MLDRNDVINLSNKETDINQYLMSLYNMAVQINAKTILEMGAGESTLALTVAVNKTEGQFYSMDLSPTAVNRSTLNASEDLKKEPRYHFIEGDNMKLVKDWDLEVDFLFHDTSHVYDHTKAELAVWPKFVRKGGLYVMHDTAHEAGDGMGCRKALNEFLETEEGKQYRAIHLLDTKLLGMSVLIKL